MKTPTERLEERRTEGLRNRLTTERYKETKAGRTLEETIRNSQSGFSGDETIGIRKFIYRRKEVNESAE